MSGDRGGPNDRDAKPSPWSTPGTVAGFASAPPNEVLVRFARDEFARAGSGRALDIGCGAGRNSVPLAQVGWDVLCVDDALPMLAGAAQRALGAGARVQLALAAMDRLPVREASCDLLVAHGIWNLARSGSEFRAAVREAARVAKPGAALFVFTFSRGTIPHAAEPVVGETFVFTQFSGEPQCFLTREQLLAELADAGFTLHAGVELREYNRPAPGFLPVARGPVIWEAAFRRSG